VAELIGTPVGMAPELLRGEPASVPQARAPVVLVDAETWTTLEWRTFRELPPLGEHFGAPGHGMEDLERHFAL